MSYWGCNFSCYIFFVIKTTCCLTPPSPPQKPLPFLRDCCRLEYCLNPGSQGACKATRRKFEKGEVRFVCTAGDPQKKIYLSVAAAGDELAPVLQHVGRRAFSPTQVGGLEDLAAEDRRRFCQVGA